MISLVVPVLTEAPALRRNLPRWQALTGDKEIVVVDGGSRDESREVAREFGATVVPSARGRGTQMNTGARAARGSLLVFLHADSWLDPEALDDVQRILADERVWVGVFRQHIEGRRLAYRGIERFADWRASRFRNPYGDSGLFVRRPLFEQLGGFPDVPLCEDLGLAIRLRQALRDARTREGVQGRVALAGSRIHLSARRWESRGVLRTTLVNWWVAVSYRLGVSPQRLYRAYYGQAYESSGES